jgi:hypothetical protein
MLGAAFDKELFQWGGASSSGSGKFASTPKTSDLIADTIGPGTRTLWRNGDRKE